MNNYGIHDHQRRPTQPRQRRLGAGVRNAALSRTAKKDPKPIVLTAVADLIADKVQRL
jgi:hypothetical protein